MPSLLLTFGLIASLIVNFFFVFQLKVEQNKHSLSKQRVESLEKRNQSSSQKESQSSEILSRQKEEINHLRLELEEYSTLMRQNEQNLKKSKGEYTSIKNKLNENVARLESSQKQWDQEKKRYEEQLKEATSDVFIHQVLKKKAHIEIQLDEALARLTNETKNFEKKEQDYKMRLEKKQRELKSLKTSAPYSKDQVAYLESEVGRLNQLVDVQKKRENDLNQSLDDKVKVIDKLAIELATYKKQVDGKEKWFADLEKKYNTALNTFDIAQKTIDEQARTIDILQQGISKQAQLIQRKKDMVFSLKNDIVQYLKTVEDKKEGLSFLSDTMREHIRHFERSENEYAEEILKGSEQKSQAYRQKVSSRPDYQGHLFKKNVPLNRQIKGTILEIDIEQSVVFANVGGEKSVQKGQAFYIVKKGRRIATAHPFIIRDHLTAFNFKYLDASAGDLVEKGDLIVS